MPQQPLPRTVAQLARLIGRENALALAGAAGRALYVPKTMRPGHRIVAIIGAIAASRLCREHGGEIVYLAKCFCAARAFRDTEINRLAAAGETPKAIAELMGLTDRQVRNIVRKSAPMDAAARPFTFRPCP